MDTKYTLKRKYKTSTLDNKVIAKQRKKDIDLNTMTKKQLIEQITSLKEELVKLKSIYQSSKDKIEDRPCPKSTQTTLLDDELTFPCQSCIYNAASEMDLRVHMDYAHDLDDEVLLSNFKCNVCKNVCKSKRNLMNHIKTIHGDTLPNCKFFQTNSCKYNEKYCWFIHKKDVLQELKCRYCEQTFHSKRDVMFHQKNNHEDKVPICKNHIQSKCKYKHKCWFTHPAVEPANHTNIKEHEIDLSTKINSEDSESNASYS